MVKRQIIHKRLNKLDEYLSILQEAQKYSYEEFIASPERYGSVERFLQLALEVLIDLGNHIVADDELGEVGYQRDIPADSREWLHQPRITRKVVSDDRLPQHSGA